MDINTFQLKMLGKSLLKLTLIMMAASAFIDKTGFFETLMKKYLLKVPKSLITFAVAFMAASTFFLALSLTLFTEKVVCKMVGDGEDVVDRTLLDQYKPTAEQEKGLVSAGLKTAVLLMTTTFMACVFIDMVNKSNIFKIVVIVGAELLRGAHVGILPLCLLVIFITTLVNPFMTSGSSKWLLIAPMIVPMFVMLNVHPAYAQDPNRKFDMKLEPMIPVIRGEKALEAVTINPARVMGVEARGGILAPGKDADLVIWKDRPFVVIQDPVAVFINGERI